MDLAAGCYQLTDSAAKDKALPTRFEDIVALVALYRPGPMELIPDYVARKSGRERVEYLGLHLPLL